MMKRKMMVSGIALAILLFAGVESSTAQRFSRGDRACFAPTPAYGNFDGGRSMQLLDLTEEQAEQISALRAKNQKSMRLEAAMLREKQARLSTLMITPEENSQEINKIIDEISEAKGQLMKTRFAHQQEIRGLLTDDQKGQLVSPGFGRGFNRIGDDPGFGPGYGRAGHPGKGMRGQRR